MHKSPAAIAMFGALVGSCLDLAPPAQAADGATLFAQNCALCHQSAATGLAGQFPRLAGRVGFIGTKAPGRAYLIDVLTYGMAGQVVVDGQPIIGVMPSLPLGDDDVASILSYVGTLGSAKAAPFTAEEVAAERSRPCMSSAEVHAERQRLVSAKLIE
jgi:mono/diheme cytochrome c family protein